MPDISNVEETKAPAAAPVNRDIERFLSSCPMLEIDFERGMMELNRYLSEIELLKSGVPFASLGISDRRAAGLPRSVWMDAATGAVSGQPGPAGQRGAVRVLSLTGIMRAESGLSTRGVDSLIENLRSAYSDSNVSAVIVEGNSPGGESIAGTMLKSAISERNKPVIGFGHMIASAAYRAFSGMDEVIASNAAAEFGSIGTMFMMDMKALNDYRAGFAEFYGADAPEKNAEHRSAVAGNFAKMQNRVDQLTKNFQKEIAKDRNLTGGRERAAETLNGSMWTADEAKGRGLIDSIGNLNHAIKRASALSRIFK